MSIKYSNNISFLIELVNLLTPSRFIGHEEALNYAAKLSISKSTGER